MLWAQCAVSSSLPQSHTGCHQPCAVPFLSPSLSPCRQLPDLVPHGLNPFLPRWVVSAAAWAVPVLGMVPLPGLSFPTALPSSSRYWCLDAGGRGVMVVAGTCTVAPHSPHGPNPGVGGWQGIAVAKLHHGSSTGKPSPWPPRDVWLCYPLPCGAFPLPSVSQTPARPSLREGAGAGGHKPALPPACSACGTSPGLGTAVPEDTGAACALRGKTPSGHCSPHGTELLGQDEGASPGLRLSRGAVFGAETPGCSGAR